MLLFAVTAVPPLVMAAVLELADSGGFADTEFAADFCRGAAGFFHGFSFVELGHDLLGVVFREFLHVV